MAPKSPVWLWRLPAMAAPRRRRWRSRCRSAQACSPVVSPALRAAARCCLANASWSAEDLTSAELISSGSCFFLAGALGVIPAAAAKRCSLSFHPLSSCHQPGPPSFSRAAMTRATKSVSGRTPRSIMALFLALSLRRFVLANTVRAMASSDVKVSPAAGPWGASPPFLWQE